MPMDPQDILSLIKKTFPDAKAEITDLRGDGDHYALHIVSASFFNKSRIAQHQMVYRALKGKMGGDLHALALKTSTPKETSHE